MFHQVPWGYQEQQQQRHLEQRSAAAWPIESYRRPQDEHPPWGWQRPPQPAYAAQPAAGWPSAGCTPAPTPPPLHPAAGVPAAAQEYQRRQPPSAGVLKLANHFASQQHGAGHAHGHAAWAGHKGEVAPVAAAAANSHSQTAQAPQAALNACRCLNNRLRRTTTAEELFAVLAAGWQSLDCINLAAALHHLAHLAEAAPGGADTFCRRHLLGDPRWGWLLDELPRAAGTPGFGPQCVANCLAALCKLDALSPPLLRALREPLLHALASAVPAERLSTRGLTQLLWCIGKDAGSLKPLVLSVIGPLLEALWVAAPALDAQGVSTAWWALGVLVHASSPDELPLCADSSDLLPRLAAAARATASDMSFQGLAQVLHACIKMRPGMYRDMVLLQSLTSAVADRLRAGKEQPTPQAVSLICLSLGRLSFHPRCQWSLEGELQPSILDTLGAAMAARLSAASPQEVSNFMIGLGLLHHAPPAPVLRTLLERLGSGDEGLSGQTTGGATADRGDGARHSGRDVQQGHGDEGIEGGSGHTRSPCRLQLQLERYSSQQLADVVCALQRMLRGGGKEYPNSLIPPQVVEGFFDALDTVLCARASMATRFSPGRSSELALTGQHVGAIMGSLGRLTAIWPSAVLTDVTLVELEQHVMANPYDASSLASFLHYFVLTGIHPGPQAVEGVCERALALLHHQELLPAPHQQQPAFPFSSLAKLLAAVAALAINHPRLLCAVLPATAAALERAQAEQRPGSMRELVTLAAALGQLHEADLLAPTGMPFPDALLPLWHQLMHHMAQACAATGNDLSPHDAAMVQRAAAQLSRECGSLWLPPFISLALAHRQH